MYVRLAHPLYGEVRRMRSAHLRLRRLRGLVAQQLAASDDADDIRIAVRCATLALDSDLDPEPHLLLRAAQYAPWLMDMSLAERLASRSIRAGGGVEANLLRGYALFSLDRGEEADATLADVTTAELAEADHANVAFLRAANKLFALADPTGRKSLSTTCRRERHHSSVAWLGE
jgi:hypothetical protein